jgi:hypothetical protein
LALKSPYAFRQLRLNLKGFDKDKKFMFNYIFNLVLYKVLAFNFLQRIKQINIKHRNKHAKINWISIDYVWNDQ